MEPVAVNRVTITRDLFTESHEAVFSVRRQRTLLFAGMAFLLAGLILIAFQSRLPNGAAIALPPLLTGAVVILWALTLKKADLRKKYRAFQQKNGDAPRRVIVFDRTGMDIDTGGEKPVRIEYTDVKEWKETPRMYLLLCGGHVGVQLAKDGFETGSWDAVLQAMDHARQEAEAMMELI